MCRFTRASRERGLPLGEWNDLVKYRLERAKETLVLAKDLLERGYYKDSNRRS